MTLCITPCGCCSVASREGEFSVREGELCLGTWQRVLFIELDRERDRRWLIQVVGN